MGVNGVNYAVNLGLRETIHRAGNVLYPPLDACALRDGRLADAVPAGQIAHRGSGLVFGADGLPVVAAGGAHRPPPGLPKPSELKMTGPNFVMNQPRKVQMPDSTKKSILTSRQRSLAAVSASLKRVVR